MAKVIDGAVVAGYVAVHLSGAARRFGGGWTVDRLRSLHNRVVRKLGSDIMHDLRRNPDDATALDRLAKAIEDVASVDRRFADQLAAIVHRLDRGGGRKLVNQVQAPGVIDKTNSGAPAWATVVTVLGATSTIGGFVLILVDIATVMSSGEDQFPSLAGVKWGAIVFASGMVLSFVGALGRSMSGRGWRRSS